MSLRCSAKQFGLLLHYLFFLYWCFCLCFYSFQVGGSELERGDATHFDVPISTKQHLNQKVITPAGLFVYVTMQTTVNQI